MYGRIMFNFLTNSTFRILLTSLVISIINIVIIMNTPRLTTIDYVDSQDIYKKHKGEIFYYEDSKRAVEEYQKNYKERVAKLREIEGSGLLSLQTPMVFLAFLPWVVFPFMFPIIKKKLPWVFFFPILFSLFGIFPIIQLIAIGVILTFSFYIKTKFEKSNRKTEP